MTRPSISLLKASDGDCIFVRCGGGALGYNILVDAGRPSIVGVLQEFLDQLPAAEQRIDLFVVTHIDADHIAGAIAVAKNAMLSGMIRSVWFNGARHLIESDGQIDLSPSQGDDFSAMIEKNGWNWNQASLGRAIVREQGELIQLSEHPVVKATILSPSRSGLADLAGIWPVRKDDEEREDDAAIAMGEPGPPDVPLLAAGAYEADRALPNGSSIAFVLELSGIRIALNADAHAETLVTGIEEFFDGKLCVDLATLPHHGSRKNMSHCLAAKLVAPTWTISTEGNQKHNFPNGESIARVLAQWREQEPIRLVFNSDHPEALAWGHSGAQAAYNYIAAYPAVGASWVTVQL